MKVVIVEFARQGEDHQQISGQGLRRLRLVRPRARPAAKDGSVDPENDFAMRWEVDAKSAKRLGEIGGAVKNAERVILATDPDREGEAISWHVHEILARQEAA